MCSIKVRDVEIGGNMPVICLPVVGKTQSDVIEQIENIVKSAENIPQYIVEWRIDWFDAVFDENALYGCAKKIREKLGNVPLLITFRTACEGGEKAVEAEEYKKLCLNILSKGIADILDIELFLSENFISEIVSAAKKANVKIIMSNHDFEKTPPTEEILSRLENMENAGGDICKIAVMPQNKVDVARLLQATAVFGEKSNVPVVTMSMGGKGLISRLSGEAFGSAITFGCVGKASAPGQINAEKLYTALEIIHEGMSS